MRTTVIKGVFALVLSAALLLILISLLRIERTADTYVLSIGGAIVWLLVLLMLGLALRHLQRKRTAVPNGSSRTVEHSQVSEHSATRMVVFGSILLVSSVVLAVGCITAMMYMNIHIPPMLPAIVLTIGGGAGFILLTLGLVVKKMRN